MLVAVRKVAKKTFARFVLNILSLLAQNILLSVYSGCVWLRKSISGKYFIFRKGKCIQVFGCARNSFYGNEIYGKSFPAFVSGKYFPENEIHFFTENHFSCLVCVALPK